MIARDGCQRSLAGVELVHAHRIGAERAPHFPRHASHDLVGRFTRRENRAHAQEHLGFPQPLPCFLEETAVGHGQGQLAGDSLGQLDLEALEGARLAHDIQAQQTDHLALTDQGRHQVRSRVEDVHPVTRNIVGAARVVDDHRAMPLDGARVRGDIDQPRGREPDEGLPEIGALAPVGELRHEWQHSLSVPARDGAAIDPADLGDGDGHLAEHLLGVKGGVEDARDLQQGSALVEETRRLRVEARIADGQGRMVGDAGQGGLVALRERARQPPRHEEKPLHPLLTGDGDEQTGPEFFLTGHLAILLAHSSVGGKILDSHGAPGRHARARPGSRPA